MGHFRLDILRAESGRAHRQGDNCGNDNQLPTPEMDPARLVAKRRLFEQALQGIVNTHKNGVAHKCENHSIGMQQLTRP